MLKNRNLVSLALLVSSVSFSGASAAGLDGGYVGVQAGPWFGSSEASYSNGTDTASFDGISTDGFAGGVFAGYGKKNGNIYFGGELEFSGTTADSTGTVNASSATLDIEYLYFAHARLGYFLSDSAMVYAKAGVGGLHWKASTSGGLSDSDDQWGAAFGAGMEHTVGKSLSLRAEFLYTLYEDYKVTQGNETVDVDPSSLTARVGISYQF